MRIINESENNLYLKRGLGSGDAYALQYRSDINQKVFEKIEYELLCCMIRKSVKNLIFVL